MIKLRTLLAAFVASGLSAWAASAPPLGVATDGICVSVIDGDTIDVSVSYRVRVRLLDCYAPESRTTDLAEKKRGLKAKADLTQLALGKPVVLHIPTSGAKSATDILTLNRVLGYVWVEGSNKSLSEIQVANGNATATKTAR